MKTGEKQLAGIASVLIIALLITAGCTSIPGPDVRFTPSPTHTVVPVPTAVKTAVVKTPIPATTPSPVMTTITATPAGSYETRSCSQMGGSVVRAGEMCPGTWLDATDSFSCCSKPPVTAISRNASITVQPFNLVIEMEDDPGSILP